jgi:hypothetical protein
LLQLRRNTGKTSVWDVELPSIMKKAKFAHLNMESIEILSRKQQEKVFGGAEFDCYSTGSRCGAAGGGHTWTCTHSYCGGNQADIAMTGMDTQTVINVANYYSAPCGAGVSFRIVGCY